MSRLAAVLAGVAATGCTPLRIVLKTYPDEFDHDLELVNRTLYAFACTVVPEPSDELLVLQPVYHDPYYPLSKYSSFLASDLCRRSADLFGVPAFDQLEPSQREAVVLDGVNGGGVCARLYEGAIFLTQIAFYAGIADDERGCPAIEFDGPYQFRGVEATSYPDPQRYLPSAITSNGNPA